MGRMLETPSKLLSFRCVRFGLTIMNYSFNKNQFYMFDPLFFWTYNFVKSVFPFIKSIFSIKDSVI